VNSDLSSLSERAEKESAGGEGKKKKKEESGRVDGCLKEKKKKVETHLHVKSSRGKTEGGMHPRGRGGKGGKGKKEAVPPYPNFIPRKRKKEGEVKPSSIARKKDQQKGGRKKGKKEEGRGKKGDPVWSF